VPAIMPDKQEAPKSGLMDKGASRRSRAVYENATIVYHALLRMNKETEKNANTHASDPG